MDNTVAMNNGRKECTITWFIENYSYCWHNNGQRLASPEFTADVLDNTCFFLNLYPRGATDSSKSHISLFLSRRKYDFGPEVIPLKYELSVLAPNGSVLISREIEHTFARGCEFGSQKFVHMDEIFLRRKVDFLHQDRLCVRCIIWKDEGNIQSVSKFTAITRIEIEHISFLHVVKGFSALKPNEKNTMVVESPTIIDVVSSSVYYSNDSCEGKIMVEITKYDQILSKCKLSLLDGSGKLIKSSKADNRFNANREDIKKLPVPLTRTVILNRKSEYLSGDELSLLCDCTFSTQRELGKIEQILHRLPLAAVDLISNDQNKDTYNSAEKLSTCTSALDDFKAIFHNQFLADVKIKAKTKSFYAHKIVLSARSTVFKAMLTNDMKEKNMNCIQVDDLEDDTVQQLLMFLYSDKLENLQWESAIKLYNAADKYYIVKLKLLCSSFLVDNLGTSNAVELLLLADTHNDSDLRKMVENFIFEYEEEVYGSDEWENLIEINPQLVIRTMNLKYKRRKVGK